MRLVHEVMQAWSKAEKPMRRDKEGFHKVTVERKMKPWVYSLCRLRVAVKRKAKTCDVKANHLDEKRCSYYLYEKKLIVGRFLQYKWL